MSTSDDVGRYGIGEPDRDQLQYGDTLDDRGVSDVLDEGYSPPEKWSVIEKYGNTWAEERQGEGMDRKLAAEEPDTDPYADNSRRATGPGGQATDDDWATEECGARRAGRLVNSSDSDVFASDAGIDGAGASAEEAAVHIIDEDVDD